MTIAGANDFEPGFTANAAQSRAWLNGYLSATTRPFVFNGSADGCSWTTVQRGCNNGWTASDLHWLSGGASPNRIVGLPQIYNHDHGPAVEVHLADRRRAQPAHRIKFGGPLTECDGLPASTAAAAAWPARSAWTALWSAIRSDARTSQTQPALLDGSEDQLMRRTVPAFSRLAPASPLLAACSSSSPALAVAGAAGQCGHVGIGYADVRPPPARRRRAEHAARHPGRQRSHDTQTPTAPPAGGPVCTSKAYASTS